MARSLYLLLLLVLSRRSISDTQLTCLLGSGEACPETFCPGDEVEYTCDVGSPLGNTVWAFPAGTCEEQNNEIILLQSGINDCAEDKNSGCAGFSAANTDPGGDQDCTVSVLTVNVNQVSDGILIKCLNFNGSSFEIGKANIIKRVAPPPPTGVSVASCTGGDSVALVWEDPTDTTVTSYTLRATPPVENCDPTCNTVGREYVFTGLQPEQSYELSVQGINCGDQIGGESTFNVTIPTFPLFNVCPVYSGDSGGSLVSMKSFWEEIMVAPCPVMQYNITYDSDTSEPVTNTVLPSECSSAGECSHTFTVPVNDSASQYSVTVTAVGLGVTSNTRTVATVNNVLLVEVNASTQAVVATCSFLSGLSGDALCRVDFTGPDGVTYTSVSTERGSAGESVTVEQTLNGATLLPSTKYSYQATLEDPSDEPQCVEIIGQFTTGMYSIDCSQTDLGASVSDSSKYVEGEMAGAIPNGMLCYTGLTPGSTATYSCDKGYELNGSSVLVCQANGLWNGTGPTCMELAGAGGLSTGAVVGIVFGAIVLLLVVLVVVCAVIYFTWAAVITAKKSNRKTEYRALSLTTFLGGPIIKLRLETSKLQDRK